jgi:pimeloyl-ACP methyl ester carboxylesterase
LPILRRVLILAAIALSCAGSARADAFLLVVQSATIAKTKADGKPWDLGVGKKAWPDPYVKIWVYDADGGLSDSGETATIWDTFTPAWNHEAATVTEGCKIRLEVWDKDLKYDDLIGKYEFKLTADTIKHGELTLKFGQVEKLHLVFRPAPPPGAVARILLQQAFPGPWSAKKLQRSEDCELAVVLVHGLDLHHDSSPAKEARPQKWQGSTSTLVKALSRYGDVFSISYPQTSAVEEIADFPELHSALARIKGFGYTQLVLMGHSAGGLIVRHFVEDRPDTGITRVVQVATPNAGAHLADWGVKLGQFGRDQEPFVKSLGPAHRAAVLKNRHGRLVPAGIDFVTVVCVTAEGGKGDGVVSRQSQWPLDLQEQRIPCVRVHTNHHEVMLNDDSVKVLCALAAEPQPRWSAARVRDMRRELGLPAK